MPGLGWGRARRSSCSVWWLASFALCACDIDTVPSPANSGIQEDGGHSPGVITDEPEPIIGINTEVISAAPIITPPARIVPTRCGDGELDPGEKCDPGKDVCCADDCSGPKQRGVVCREAAGPCDLEDVCDGESLACPEDGLRREGYVCRKAEGDCDVAEACDGETRPCPDDVFLPPTTMCRGAREECDEAEFCTGESGTCPSDGVASEEKVCRPQAEGQLCDAVEHCDGRTKTCPPDAVRPAEEVCHVSEGSCDSYAVCDGQNAECPPLMDGIAPAGAVCHAAKGPCDFEEKCDGETAICPEDRKYRADENHECRAKAGDCDHAAEACNGESVDCPQDTLEQQGHVCREARGVCDVEETCSGESPACPPDVFAGQERVCKAVAGGCDIADVCSGSSRDCPGDRFDVGRPCNPSRGVCDVAEVCGEGPNCPADTFAVGTPCRSANENEVCDAPEVCGNGPNCPADVGVTDNRVCRDADDTTALCDTDARCDGSPECPAANPVAARGTGCRVANGMCDVAEVCDGTSRQCPADGFAGNERMCRGSSGDACDAPEFCNGMGRNCPADVGVTDGHVCRDASSTTAECDGDARCNGSPTCPAANPPAASGTVCRAMNGVCDVAETCNGTSLDCPGDGFAGTSQRCRDASNDPCDVAEFCTSRSRTCPANAGVTDGRVCRAGVATPPECDGDALCDGSPTCPATNPPAPRGTQCRGLLGDCDVAETCDGTSFACPSDAFDTTRRECRAKNPGRECDVAENCNGGRDCPADIGVSATANRLCGSPASQTNEPCDADAHCNGSPVCPPNPPVPAGANRAPCNPSDGVCDPAEFCDGTQTSCPTDQSLPDGSDCSEFTGSPGRCSMGVCCPGATKIGRSGFCEIQNASIVFVTSRLMPGSFGGLTQGDAICKAAAEAANLAGTYRAWLSTLDAAGAPAVNARDRIGQRAPWARISDGKIVLASLADLTDRGLSAAVLSDEWGIPHEVVTKNRSPVWTGTLRNGTAGGANCQNWAPPEPARATGYFGYADQFESGLWTFQDQAAQCTGQAALYCFQFAAARIDASRAE